MQVAYHLSKFLGGKPLADLTEKERMRLAEGAVLGGPYERPPGSLSRLATPAEGLGRSGGRGEEATGGDATVVPKLDPNEQWPPPTETGQGGASPDEDSLRRTASAAGGELVRLLQDEESTGMSSSPSAPTLAAKGGTPPAELPPTGQ